MSRVWWVNQKQTFQQEHAGGYLWSPKRKSDNTRNPYYDSMRMVAPGDLILSYVDGQIVAYSSAVTYAYEFPKPDEFGKAGSNWSSIGWRVDVEYRDLGKPFAPKSRLDAIIPLLPAKYSPLGTDGNGRQNMYLTLLPEALGELLLDLIGVAPRLDVMDVDAINAMASSIALQRIDEWEAEIAQQIANDPRVKSTDREELVLARRGQGKFRKELMSHEKACRVTKVENPTHLVASHCKPWRDATHEERLDGESGLLLVPTVDHLFDQGFLSFENDGEMILSPVADRLDLRRMGIPTEERIRVGSFSAGQRAYLDYHRDYVFKAARHLS
jgi:hypothetical protein